MSTPPDRESPAIGGLETARKLQEEGSRVLTRSSEENEKRLLSGEAWSEFCRTLEAAGRTILDAPGREDPWVQAEGFRYLLGLTKVGISQAAELTPEQPRFIRIVDSFVGGGAENADNAYAHAHIRGDFAYRVWGTRGTVDTFLVELKEGFMQLGDVRNFATLEASELEIEPDGTFEFFVGGAPREKNWIPLDPAAKQILVRQYFCDWDTEMPATFDIECLGREGVPPEKVSAARAAEILDDAARQISGTASFWQEWVVDLRARYDPDAIQPAKFYVGGADDIAYGNDYYVLPEGEAMVIEFEPPKAKYWAFQLIDLWYKTPDWANCKNSINHAQAWTDGDGCCRIVVAHEDPGVANWLDTAGEQEGVLQYRWIWTEDNPQPRVRRVPVGEVRSALPADTPSVSPEERRAEIHGRQLHRLRRERI